MPAIAELLDLSRDNAQHRPSLPPPSDAYSLAAGSASLVSAERSWHFLVSSSDLSVGTIW